MEARIGAIENTLMLQSGALWSAKEQAEAHREDRADRREIAVSRVQTAAKHEAIDLVTRQAGATGLKLRVADEGRRHSTFN